MVQGFESLPRDTPDVVFGLLSLVLNKFFLTIYPPASIKHWTLCSTYPKESAPSLSCTHTNSSTQAWQWCISSPSAAQKHIENGEKYLF